MAQLNGHAGAASMPSPLPGAGGAELGIGDVLSPSQVATFLECSAKWWFRHGLKLESPRSAGAGLGSAVHTAVGENYAQKIETQEDLDVAGVRATFRAAWRQELKSVQLAADEDPAELGAVGEDLVQLYMDEIAPKVQPAAVELPVSGQIGGVRVRGKVDLVTVEGRIEDLKTAAKSPSGIAPDYRRQISTYSQITPGVSGSARLVTLTKTKTPKAVPQEFSINGADLQEVNTLFPMVQEGMRAGLYFPHRTSNTCSRKYCPYWQYCQREFGGEVRP